MKLFILRGLPGAGKTTLAKLLAHVLPEGCEYSADAYFEDDAGNYNFDMTKLGTAHLECQRKVREAMKVETHNIIVHNTSTTEKEMKPYFDMAEEFGYQVISLVVENRHGSINVHNVPQEALDRMRARFSVVL